MSDRSRVPGSEALSDCWRRWTVIVDIFARRSLARRGVDPSVYNTLHRELIATCRSLADGAGDESRAYYEGLEELARPWLSPKTLAQADREILDGLLARCREVEAELGGRSRFSAALGWSTRALLAVSVLAGSILLLWAWGVDLDVVSALDRVRGWSDVIWITVRRTSDMEKLAIVTALVLLASVYGVSRTARS
jgi:hypothetical protein